MNVEKKETEENKVLMECPVLLVLQDWVDLKVYYSCLIVIFQAYINLYGFIR